MNNTTETTATVYTLAIDWQEGRTPNYEAHLRWMCTEEQALSFFRKDTEGTGYRRALVGPDGSIIETRDAF